MDTVKLANSIILSEEVSWDHRRRPLTGAKIIKTAYGPELDKYNEHLRWLEQKGRIKINNGSQLSEPTSFECLSLPEIISFDAQELEIMSQVGEICCNKYVASAFYVVCRYTEAVYDEAFAE